MADSDRRLSPVYNVRETTKARDQLNKIAAMDGRFAELWQGVSWLLQRDPEVGTLLPGMAATYVYLTEDFLAIGLPVLHVTYSIVDAKARVLEIIEVNEMVAEEDEAKKPADKSGAGIVA